MFRYERGFSKCGGKCEKIKGAREQLGGEVNDIFSNPNPAVLACDWLVYIRNLSCINHILGIRKSL